MRTARSLPYGVSLPEIPLHRDPPAQRLPAQRPPVDSKIQVCFSLNVCVFVCAYAYQHHRLECLGLKKWNRFQNEA